MEGSVIYRWMVEQGRENEQTTERQVEVWLAKSGYSHDLAKGVGWVPPESEFLKRAKKESGRKLMPA